MSIFWHLFKIKKKSISLLLFVLILILILNTYQFFFQKDIFEPANSLIMSSLFSQIGIIVFMIIGLMLANISLQKRNVCPGDVLIDWAYNIILISILTGIFYMFSISVVLIPFFTLGIQLEIFEVIKFTIIYWALPFLISGITGFSIFMIVKNNFSLVFIILFSITLGTIGDNFIKDTLYEKISLFHHNPTFQFHPLYGLPIDPFNLFKRISILFFSLMVFPIYIAIRPNYRSKKNRVVILILLTSFVSSIILTSHYPVTSHGNEKYSTIKTDPEYYKDIPTESPKKIEQINFNKIIGNVQIKDQTIYANLKLFLNKNSVKNTFYFSLYNGFEIDYIRDKEGNNITFNRYGDMILVNTKSPIDEIHISYEGKSSPLYPAGRRSIFLPGYFPWLPTDNINQAFESIGDNAVHRNSLIPIDLITYDIDVSTNSKYKLFVNGKIESKIKEKSRGITLLSNDIKSFNIKGKKYILPSSWKNTKPDLSIIKEEGENIIEYTNFIFSKNYKLPENIIIFPITVHSDYLLEEDVWFSEKTLIVNFPFYFTMRAGVINNPARMEEYIVGMVAAVTWKQDHFNWKDKNMMILFDSFIAESFFIKNDYDSNYFNSTTEIIIQNNPAYAPVIEEIKSLLDEDNQKLTQIFMYQWYEKAKKNNGLFTEKDLIHLLEVVRNDHVK